MEFVFVDEERGHRYPGTGVSFGHDHYKVRCEGSRYIVDMPERLEGVPTAVHLAPMCFVPVGEVTAVMVERAAQAAMRKNDEEKFAKAAAELNMKPEEVSNMPPSKDKDYRPKGALPPRGSE